MRFAVQVPPFVDPGAMVDVALEAGATWYVEGAWPEGDWFEPFRARIRKGPAA